MKRPAFLFCLLILILGMTGCRNQSLPNNSQIQTISSQMQSSIADKQPQSSSAVPSSENAVSSDVTVQSRAPISSGGSATSSDTSSPQTQQETLKQVKTVLNTKVSLMLPKSLPVEKGHYLTATTASQAQDYKVNLYEVKQPAAINSKAASNGTLIATVEGTKYQNASSAKNSISAYEKVNVSGTDQTLDLGHNIKAVANAGLGHQQLTWNEGRWCLWVDSPSDSAYKNKEYPDGKQLAKNVVAYLENYMLPAPQDIGVIYIGDWDGNQVDNTTTINLQRNQTVYQIICADPVVALKVAVAMKG